MASRLHRQVSSCGTQEVRSHPRAHCAFGGTCPLGRTPFGAGGGPPTWKKVLMRERMLARGGTLARPRGIEQWREPWTRRKSWQAQGLLEAIAQHAQIAPSAFGNAIGRLAHRPHLSPIQCTRGIMVVSAPRRA